MKISICFQWKYSIDQYYIDLRVVFHPFVYKEYESFHMGEKLRQEDGEERKAMRKKWKKA